MKFKHIVNIILILIAIYLALPLFQAIWGVEPYYVPVGNHWSQEKICVGCEWNGPRVVGERDGIKIIRVGD